MTSDRSFPGDLQEPFRWIADVAVLEAFESGVLDLPDFYFTGDDYRYRFEPEAKERFLDLLRERFNSGVKYKGRAFKWDTIIEHKASELGRFLVGKSTLNFVEPSPKLTRADCQVLRARTLSLTRSEAQELGFAKSKLHHLRRNAESKCGFRIYNKTDKRLRRISLRI